MVCQPEAMIPPNSLRRSLCRIQVKILRIVLPRELDDLRFAHRDRPELVHVPGCIVLEETLVRRYRKVIGRHPSPRDAARKAKRSGCLGREFDFFKRVRIRNADQACIPQRIQQAIKLSDIQTARFQDFGRRCRALALRVERPVISLMHDYLE